MTTIPRTNHLGVDEHARFHIRQVLGKGGMGVVYQAYDHSRQRMVALKKLRHLRAESLYRFKQEFRIARRINHPNVVSLYELVEDRGDWFFTMEFVDGQHFIDALNHSNRSADASVAPDPLHSTETIQADHQRQVSPDTGTDDTYELAAQLSLPPPCLSERVDVDKLRSCIRQLARALVVSHAAGVIHRDIKPSNILVTANGRVVLTDFGVAANIDKNQPTTSSGEVLIGTPSFMAPEQLMCDTPTAAVDWYAFGTVLYLALAGRLPYIGDLREVLYCKKNFTPMAPSVFCQGVPEDLEKLCMGLLHPRSEHRMRTDEILSILDDRDPYDAESAWRPVLQSSIFVGRQEEMQRLWDAYEGPDTSPSCVMVCGPSGIGKSRLVEQFLAEVDDYGIEHSKTFSTCCHEREMFSHMAFDGIVEQIVDTLMDLPEERRSTILPEDMAALVTLFPAFQRVVPNPANALEDGNKRRVRQRGYVAFAAFMSGFARCHPTVICIDALHWADFHSLSLLRYLMSNHSGGRLLVLTTYRSDDIGGIRSARFKSFLDLVTPCHGFVELALPPLTDKEQSDLLDACIGEASIEAESSREICVQVSGHPLLLTEMARHARESSSSSIPVQPVQFDDMLWAHIARLPPLEALVLELVAVAREPVPAHILADATRGDLVDVERALASLSKQQLTRISSSTDEIWPDIYHIAMREAILRRLGVDEQRALHRALAAALECWPEASAALIATHCTAAQDPFAIVRAGNSGASDEREYIEQADTCELQPG